MWSHTHSNTPLIHIAVSLCKPTDCRMCVCVFLCIRVCFTVGGSPRHQKALSQRDGHWFPNFAPTLEAKNAA